MDFVLSFLLTWLLVLGLWLICGWYVTQPGRIAKRLERTLAQETETLVITNCKELVGATSKCKPPMLVTGQAVVAGKHQVPLWIRASHLAMLRMVQDAKRLGYDAIGNVRLEISFPADSFSKTILVAIAYGTAYDLQFSVLGRSRRAHDGLSGGSR